MPRPASLPPLPGILPTKIHKTGESRGATTKEIYQNRVLRNNTVLIRWSNWHLCKPRGFYYERGFIVLVEPSWYFETADADARLAAEGLSLGNNSILTFRRPADWDAYGVGRTHLPNGTPFTPATQREAPIGGVYMARVSSRGRTGEANVSIGFNKTDNKLQGAGIRVFEYASSTMINATRIQVEALLWLCEGSVGDMVDCGMNRRDAAARRDAILAKAEKQNLLDEQRLGTIRAIDEDGFTMCPLCCERMRAATFLELTDQIGGREIHDLRTTKMSLFHIEELRVGKLLHKPYNLGWGHHYCNVVVADRGIMPTLEWMKETLDRQPEVAGHLADARRSVEEAIER